MIEFIGTYWSKKKNYTLTIHEDNSSFTVTLSPEEMQSLIDCLGSIKE